MLRVAEHFEKTDTGRQRRANEDSLFARPPVFVVADGMGGAQAGEVASRIAVQAFEPALPDDGSPEERLAVRAQEANERIHTLSREDARRAGMGTTLTAAYVGEGEVSLAHVGDSRAYLWRGGELRRLTRDHSLVAELVQQGKLTEEQAEDHPQRSIITRALGPERVVEVDTRTCPAQDGDVFLLCSDGLTSMAPEDAIAGILREAASLADAGRALVDAANAAGGRDNITVVLFRLEEVLAAADAPPAVEQPTAVGDSSPFVAEVRSAVAAAEAEAGPAVAPGPGAIAPTAPPPARNRRPLVTGLLVTLAVAAVLASAGWLASRAVYFVGTDEEGIVTIYRGVPYDLPAGLRLYERFYASGVTAVAIPRERRARILDHRLRTRDDAADLVRRLELGQIGAR